MEKHVLSKSTFIRGVQCLKSLYLNKKYPGLRDRLPDWQQAVFKRGTDVGELAQQLFPKGINLRPKSPAQFRKRASDTAKIINTGAYNTLYEAVFQANELLAILDILVKKNGEWFAYEVKSSTKISETYLLDAAYQYYVISHSGLEIKDFFLVYVNKNYTFEGTLDLENLFVKQCVTSEVIEKQRFISEKIKEETQILMRHTMPDISIGTQCHNPYPCDFLSYCWRNIQENSILHLDAFEEEERYRLHQEGTNNSKVVNLGSLSEKQKIQIESAQKKSTFYDEERLYQILDALKEDLVIFSCYFVKPAIPYLLNTHPYQPIPVASSISTGNKEINFFIQEKDAVKLFILNFRKIIRSSLKIIIYDKSELIDFLNETGHHKLAEESEKKWVDLYWFFQSYALFDYRLRGNFSPQNVARIFLDKRYPLLDPSLLNMKWQMAFQTGESGNELLNNTRVYLNNLIDFQHDFMNLLLKRKSMISSQNK